jgi:hypothetical protein
MGFFEHLDQEFGSGLDQNWIRYLVDIKQNKEVNTTRKYNKLI